MLNAFQQHAHWACTSSRFTVELLLKHGSNFGLLFFLNAPEWVGNCRNQQARVYCLNHWTMDEPWTNATLICNNLTCWVQGVRYTSFFISTAGGQGTRHLVLYQPSPLIHSATSYCCQTGGLPQLTGKNFVNRDPLVQTTVYHFRDEYFHSVSCMGTQPTQTTIKLPQTEHEGWLLGWVKRHF